jgi:hypothetical protein
MVAGQAVGRGACWLKVGIGGMLYMPCVLLTGTRCVGHKCMRACDKSQHPTASHMWPTHSSDSTWSILACSRARLTCDTALKSRTMIGDIAVVLQVNST